MEWINLNQERPADGQEIICRTRNGYGTKWVYQIGIILNGNFENPAMGFCQNCGEKVQFVPFPWDPFMNPKFEWIPLTKVIDILK